MKIPLDQLPLHLKNNLLPVYFISGEELLLVQEAKDLIRHAAHQNGYLERSVYEVSKEFDWQNFLLSTQCKSLFSDKVFIELRLQEKINSKCNQALVTYLEKPPPNHLLLLSINKCDQNLQRSDWYQKLLKMGAHTPIWALDAKQFGIWIQKKLQAASLKMDLQGIQLLTELTENNLLATMQEIQKLKMLYGEGKISSDQVLNAVSDYSKFDIFALGDCLLQGDKTKTIRILLHLKQEDTEPTLVLWTISRNLRTLINLKYLIDFGKDLDILFKEFKIWPKRQPLFKNALKRHSLKELYLTLLHAQHIDCMIKGISLGNIWEEVLRLSLKIIAPSV